MEQDFWNESKLFLRRLGGKKRKLYIISPLPLLTTFFHPMIDYSKSYYFCSPLSFSVAENGSHCNENKQFLPTLKIWLHCWLA